jgi:predicted transposase/invertase (TIGR01784 family)
LTACCAALQLPKQFFKKQGFASVTRPMHDKLKNPHDKFFREILSQKSEAQSFVQHYLPSQIVALLNLDSLTISKDSFIDKAFDEHFADLLYEVTLKDDSEGDKTVYIYLLFEHKSYLDPQVPWQLLDYLCKIWAQDRKNGRLPRAIVPLVFYHGLKTWHLPTQFAQLFDVPPELEAYIPHFEHILVDLSGYTKADIQGSLILQGFLRLLKYVHHPDFARYFWEMVDLFHAISEQETGMKAIETYLTYLVRGTDKLDRGLIVDVFNQALDEQKGTTLMGTIAEELFKQGEAQGKLVGIAIGEERAFMETITAFLSYRFQIEPTTYQPALQKLDVRALNRLSKQVFTCETIAEFEQTLAQFLRESQTDESDIEATD